MKALIAAGGRATRLRPITHTINKHLIPLANKPMIIHGIEKIVAAGITDIAINVNEGETEIQKIVGDGSVFGAHVSYLEQKGGARGIAHVVANAHLCLGDDPFLFYLGDNIILGNIKQFIDAFVASQANCYLALSKVRDPQRFGVPELCDGRIVNVVEKPSNPKSDFAVTGIYLYDRTFFDAFEKIKPSARGEYEISDIHSWLIDHGYKVGYEEITGWWKDTGKPEDLLEGNQLLLDELGRGPLPNVGTVDSSATIQGPVAIGIGSHISKNTLIRGPVVIGSHCSIEGSYIGPYTSIGNGVTVIGSEIEHSIVLGGSTIRCGRRIVDSLIGSHAIVTSLQDSLPRGHKLVIGDQSVVEL